MNFSTYFNRRILSILLVGILSFGGSWLVTVYRGVPIPCVHDEYSYILAGDTFAHGRLTNPTPPMWEHFETFHELMQPTYMSKYPPGQGLFLALGQILFGQPIYGVWISTACMCMAICWMLYGWLSPRWALVGGIIGAMQFGVFTYWSQSYWGGAVAALGGALIFGALPRIFQYQRIRDALWLGLGIAFLVNSRPIEGILIGIPLGIMLLPWKIEWESIEIDRFFKKIILPFGLILLLTVVATGTYNKAVTGDARIFPHILYDKRYSAVPHLIFESLGKTPHYNNETMATDEKVWYMKRYLEKRSIAGFLKQFEEDIKRVFNFYFGYPLAIVSLIIIFLVFFSWQRIRHLLMVGIIIAATCAVMTAQPKAHYFSSFTCLVILFITYGLKYLTELLSRYRIGMIMVALLMIFQLSLNIEAAQKPSPLISLGRIVQSSEVGETFAFTRQALKDLLLSKKGKHLVIVRYSAKHNVLREWVFNDADIDHSPIVWARDMGAAKNAELLEYFKDRKVWYVDVFWDSKYGPKYDER